MAQARKRSHEEYDELDNGGPSGNSVARTLQRLQHEDARQWETVDRQSKKHKKSKKQRRAEDQENGNRPALTYAQQHKLASMVKISDLQGLILYCIADGSSPQWISVRHHNQIKKTVVLLVPGLEMAMFNGKMDLSAPPVNEKHGSPAIQDSADKHLPAHVMEGKKYNAHATTTCKNPDDYLPMKLIESTLPPALQALAGAFDCVWPIKAPGDDKYYKLHSPLHAMLTSPIPKSHEEKASEKNWKGARPAREGKDWKDKRTSIVKYLASNEELQDNDFTLHPACFQNEAEKANYAEKRRAAHTTEADGWRDSHVESLEEGQPADEEIEAGSITAGRTILCIDCEMCMVDGGEYALTRVSIVEWNGEVILDEYVKPDKPITDYLTPFSGITPEVLATVTTTLTDIQSRLLQLFRPDTIIIGHSLDSDLRALKMSHPFIADTSLLYPHPRGAPLKSSLKWLAQKYLGREIQKGHGVSGHDSVEDAQATLDLVKQKCEKGPSWGGSQANTEPISKRLLRAASRSSSPTAPQEDWNGRISAVIDHGAPERNFGSLASHCIGCQSDAEVVSGVRRAVFGDEDGAQLPGDGVRFTWARMRELEAVRGWWNDHKTDKKPDAPLLTDPDPAAVATAVAKTVEHIVAVRDCLPPCTLLVVYSGSGDPREMARLQEVQRTFKREYAVKKWDELSVRWTDVEEQALKRACKTAREGLGLVCIT